MPAALYVNNHNSGDKLTYPLALLCGEVRPTVSNATITISVRREQDKNNLEGANNSCRISSWQVFNGHFKALVDLFLGSNCVVLEIHDDVLTISLVYEPACATSPRCTYFVRPVYIRCADDYLANFQGPAGEDCTLPSALSRISFAARLLQTFTAEKMFEHFGERKTFSLETDLYPDQPACHIFTSKLCLDEARNMSGIDLWKTFARELMSSKQFHNDTHCKWFTFMSFTHYSPPLNTLPQTHSDVLKFTLGHTALGGGGLALYGTGTLHTWAENVGQVASRFADTRKIDRSKLMDDSAYREYYWANYSTGLGAALHELGHTFDLAHTPTGIMARGFDDIYRVFSIHQTTRRGSAGDAAYCSGPVPYSPRQSPLRRQSPTTERSQAGRSSRNSPSPLRSSTGSLYSSLTAAATNGGNVVQIETSFRKLHVQTTQTMTVLNYDGSQVTRTVTKHRDGVETVAEVTTFENSSKILFREFIKNSVSGKSRTTMSMISFKPQAIPQSERSTSISYNPSSLVNMLPTQESSSGLTSSTISSHRLPSSTSGVVRNSDIFPDIPISNTPDAQVSYTREVLVSSSSDDDRSLVLDHVLASSTSSDTFSSSTCNVGSLLTTSTCDALTASASSDTDVSHSESSASLHARHSASENFRSSLPDSSHSRTPSLSCDIHSCAGPATSLSVDNINFENAINSQLPLINNDHVDVFKPSTTENNLATSGLSISDPVPPSGVTPPLGASVGLSLTPVTDAVRFQETRYKDGGAHWYRSSAVLLKYHKWFNIDYETKLESMPVLCGNTVQCPLGLRVIELRRMPEGAVCHHWEFLHLQPPTQFVLDPSELNQLASSPGEVVREVVILAEDDKGNILKKKISLTDLIQHSTPV